MDNTFTYPPGILLDVKNIFIYGNSVYNLTDIVKGILIFLHLVSIFTAVNLPNPSTTGRKWHKVNFKMNAKK